MGIDSKIAGIRSIRADRTALGIDDGSVCKLEDEQGRDIQHDELAEWILEAKSIASTLSFDDSPFTGAAGSHGHVDSSIVADALNRDQFTSQGQAPFGVATDNVDRSIVADALALQTGVGWVISESLGGLSAHDPLPPHAKVVRGAQKGYIILDTTQPACQHHP